MKSELGVSVISWEHAYHVVTLSRHPYVGVLLYHIADILWQKFLPLANPLHKVKISLSLIFTKEAIYYIIYSGWRVHVQARCLLISTLKKVYRFTCSRYSACLVWLCVVIKLHVRPPSWLCAFGCMMAVLASMITIPYNITVQLNRKEKLFEAVKQRFGARYVLYIFTLRKIWWIKFSPIMVFIGEIR